MRKLLTTLFAAMLSIAAPLWAADDPNGYAMVPLSLDGIGKAYMGREIAGTMGYEAADWLDRPERQQEEGTDKLIQLLQIKPTDVIADIGAGSGYFSFRLAKLVPQGKVYAEDIQEGMLDIIKGRMKGNGATNVVPVLGGITDPRLPPGSVDLILLVDVYHEFSYPREMGLAMARALKPGGRIAQVEYRGEDPKVPIKALHKMTEAQARKEMAAVGLTWVSTDSKTLPWQHLMLFAKTQ